MADTKISRSQVAKMLKVSVASVQLLETRGKLAATREEGRVWYDKNAIDEFAKTYQRSRRGRQKTPEGDRNRGRVAAKVYACLQKGMSHRDIVIATKADPNVVRELWREYHLDFDQAEKQRKEREELAAMQKNMNEMAKAQKSAEWRQFQKEMKMLDVKKAEKSRELV